MDQGSANSPEECEHSVVEHHQESSCDEVNPLGFEADLQSFLSIHQKHGHDIIGEIRSRKKAVMMQGLRVGLLSEKRHRNCTKGPNSFFIHPCGPSGQERKTEKEEIPLCTSTTQSRVPYPGQPKVTFNCSSVNSCQRRRQLQSRYPPSSASKIISSPKMRSSSHSRTSSTSRSRSSVSSAGSAYNGGGSIMGSSSFQVGRQRDRSAEMELFSQNRKPRSNYRRPSNLGFSSNPLQSRSESKTKYQPLPASRSHIVAKIPDHLKMEGTVSSTSEVRASYGNLSPARPMIYRIRDTLKPEGIIMSKSETTLQFEDKRAVRPIIHRIRDHSEEVQPRGPMAERSEYRNNFQPAKGERAAPAWITNFEKVTIDGDASRQ
eukprot:maker-scaffold56_size446035-snap-gene-3.31 protein:Tk11510 transcript:maker-scaffold56_size446035-snap-gene-3.31-mRNA-1 annotation:"PREDICTED: hypothetical protein LOC100747732"